MTDEITPDSFLERVARAPAVGRARPAALPARYEVRGVLGEGGFGIVYDVFDLERGTNVALKMLRHASAESIYRFKREFRSLADLRHDNLVRLYELGGVGAELFFTMERVEGRRFDQWVGRDVERLRATAGQLARGLCELHSAGVLHRDVKPSNVLVDDRGRVVLLDFGLVRDLRSSASTQLAGTPLAMAPEQCAQAPFGPPADWYGLGTMLFTALTGRYPFEGPAMRVMVDKQRMPAPAVRSIAPDAPEDLAELADALLARHPSERPPGTEILRALGHRAPDVHRAREPFVGRRAELGALRAALWRSREGARVLRVEGPSGMGKTALLRAFFEEIEGEHPDAWLLHGRCHPRESVPYKGFDAAVDQLARKLRSHGEARTAALLPRDTAALAALFPSLGSVTPSTGTATPRSDGAELRRRAFGALRELLARIADEHHLVVWVDDLQWGDEDSASLLAELVREPDSPRMLFVATSRDDDPGPLAERFEQLVESGLSVAQARLPLDELRPEEAARLASLLLDPGDERAGRIARQSRGHPLFLCELAHHGHVAGLEELLHARVGALDPEAAGALRALAVAGTPITEDVLWGLCGGPAHAVLEGLVAARLVRRAGAGGQDVAIYHDLVRDVVLSVTDPTERRRLHREIARELERRGADPERIVDHWREAGEDDRAIAHAERAARRAARALAYGRAAELFTTTIELRRRVGESVGAELERERAEALAGAGRVRDAAEGLLRAAEASGPDQSRQLRAQAVSHLLAGGHVQRGLSVLNGVLDELGLRMPRSTTEATARIAAAGAQSWLRRHVGRRAATAPESRARLEALWGAYTGLTAVSPTFGLAAGAMHAAEAERSDDALHRFRARTLPAMMLVLRSGARARERARSLLLDAYADAARAGSPELELHRAYGEAMVEHFGLRLAESLPLMDRTVAMGERHGQPWSHEVSMARALRSSLTFVLGDLPRGRREIPGLVREAEERGQLLTWVLYALHLSFVWTASDGNDDRVDDLLDRIRRRWRRSDVEMQDWWIDIARLHVHLARGEPRRAYDAISRGWLTAVKHRAVTSRYHVLESSSFRARAAIALAAHDPGHGHRLLREAEACARELRAEPCPWTRCLSLAIDAGVASVRGQQADALRQLRALVPACDEAGMVLLGALARERAGHLLGGDEGAALRDAAADFYADAGLEGSLRARRFTLPGAW